MQQKTGSPFNDIGAVTLILSAIKRGVTNLEFRILFVIRLLFLVALYLFQFKDLTQSITTVR